MSENTVEIFYSGDTPAWRIKVPQPERFRGVEYDIRFRLFILPKGTLIGCWLRLFDIPEQPYFVHRVLDLSDEVVREYMSRLRDAAAMSLVFESAGTGEGFIEEISVGDTDLDSLLKEGDARIEKARASENGIEAQDPSAALEDFMDTFNTALKERKDVGKAWDAVFERFPKKSNSRRKHKGGLFGLF